MHHLWFLPFGFAVACLSPPAFRCLHRVAGPVGSATLLLLAACLWLILWESLTLPQGVRIFGRYLPSVALGMALASLPERPATMFYAFLVCLLTGLGLRELAVNNSAQIFLGLPIVAAALALPLPDSRSTRLTADLSLAVYLIHPLIMAVLLRLTGLQIGTAALGFATLSASVAFGLVLLYSPLRRLLL